MTDYTALEVQQSLYNVHAPSWTEICDVNDGYVTAVLVRGQPVILTKVASSEDYDLDSESGSDIWAVVQVGTQFFKKTGYYLSHSGCEWDGAVREVKPVTKTVTVYE